MVVGNKTDLGINPAIKKEAVESFCDELGLPLVFVSSKFNYNVDLAFFLMVSLIFHRIEQPADPSLKVSVSKKEEKCNLM